MEVRVFPDAEALAVAAADLFRARVTATPSLAVAVPAGRTPRRMYELMRARQSQAPVDYTRLRVFCVDELCPPAMTPDAPSREAPSPWSGGYFWRQVCDELVSWARVPSSRCHPFAVDAPDLVAMCEQYEATIADAGGLGLVMLGLGLNAHIACHDPPADFASRTCPVRLARETVDYILTDATRPAEISDRAVTLGVQTIMDAGEVVLLASGAAKRAPLTAAVRGPVTPSVPASILQRHASCVVLCDAAAAP